MLGSAELQTIIWTSRMVESKRFYQEVLGLRLKGASHGAAIFEVGGRELRVSPVPSTTPSEHTVLGFAVSDAGAIIAHLTELGIPFERFPDFHHDKHGVVRTPDGAKVAWFRDPDGNLLSIVQYA